VKTAHECYTVREIVEGFQYNELEGEGAAMAKGMRVSLGRPGVDGGECAVRARRTY
jgi:hypothetical protein